MTARRSNPAVEIPFDFEGNLLINTRTIINTGRMYRSILGAGGRAADRRITVAQLSELLVLLEAIASSNALYYDSTVPQRERETVAKEEDLLESELGRRDIFSGIAPEAEDATLALCRDAIGQCAALMEDRIATYLADPAAVRTALPDAKRLDEGSGSPRQFADALCAPLPPPDERAGVARRLIERNPFNGAKCVAGIMVCEPDAGAPDGDDMPGADIRDFCRRAIADRSEEDLRWLVPIMINTFRSNYLNALAADQGKGAFFAGPDIEQVMDQQVLLLRNFIIGRIARPDLERDVLDSALAQRLKSTDQFPFLGLLILLAADDGDPFSVFRNSLDDKDIILARFSAELGGRRRIIHNLGAEQFNEFKTEKLERIYARMRRRFEAHRLVDRANARVFQPAVKWYFAAKPFVNMALARLDADFRAPDLCSGINPAVEYLINEAIMPDQYLRYATYIQAINKRLRLILANRGDQDVITERVRLVLGCELVADAQPAA